VGISREGGVLTVGGISAEELAREFGTPLYVYDEETVERNFARLAGSFSYRRFRILYAAKANSNLHILRLFRSLGSGLDAVSPYEVLLGRMAGFQPGSILFTGSSVSREDMEIAEEAGALVNIDSLSQLKRYASVRRGGEVSLRLNLGYGEGYHSFLVTGGATKFGISIYDLEAALELSRELGITVKGLHTHMGSGIADHRLYARALRDLLELAERIETVGFIDVGGGFGISYRKGDPSLSIEELGRELSLLMEDFSSRFGRDVELFTEPGRYLIAEAGVLLARVVDVKWVHSEGGKRCFIGVDSGMGHLIRPALYGAHHEVVPARIREGGAVEADVVGNYCESGDVIARSVSLPPVEEGDIIAVMNAGAYGFSMSSNYNLRPRPAEVIVRKSGKAELIRRRESFEDMIRTML